MVTAGYLDTSRALTLLLYVATFKVSWEQTPVATPVWWGAGMQHGSRVQNPGR